MGYWCYQVVNGTTHTNMPKQKKKTLTVAALILAAVLAVLYLNFTRSNTVKVYYAVEDILIGTVITEEMIDIYPLSRENLNDIMFEAGEEEELIGMRTLFPLEQGTLITTSMVIQPDESIGQYFSSPFPAPLLVPPSP